MTGMSDDWRACESQEISRLAARLRARQKRRVAGRAAFATAATIAAAAIVAIAAWPLSDGGKGHDFAGISCQRVGELADCYMKKELPVDLQDQVGRHIALCPICQERMQAKPRVTWHHMKGQDLNRRIQPTSVAIRGSSARPAAWRGDHRAP